MSQNTRGIQSYFKPVVRTPTAQRPAQPRSSLSPLPSSSILSSPPSPSPSSPLSYKATPTAAKAAAEIVASDDEDEDGDGFSDDSLEDLTALLGRERPAATVPVQNPFLTPRAKRTAVAFHSPLAIIPRHKFDLKALAKDAKRDDATTASSLRVRGVTDATREDSPPEQPQDSVHGVIEDIVKDRNSKDARGVLRTVQRSDLAKTQTWYCFFDRNYRVPPSSPTPKQSKDSPWHLLTQGNSLAKERNLVSGIPQTILMKQGNLPDNLFQWMLEEVCVQKSCLIRHEYCNLIAACPDQIERLVTPERLEQLFMRLGAAAELHDLEASLVVSKPSHRPYQDRDWSCVVSFLTLLGIVAHQMSVAAAIYATQVLLRMALDQILISNVDLLPAYEDAVNQLVNAIPRSSWDSFCFDACSILYGNIKRNLIRVNALLCISIRDARSHDLRRRLAIAYLLDDPKGGRHHPDEVIIVERVIHRLAQDDFKIGPGTDFVELKAGILLVDMAVDDGSVAVFDKAEAERMFNQQVDELAARLGEIGRKINDSGMKLARTETKSVVEWVQQRLVHSVRTRKKPKKSIFDGLGREGEDDASLPRQQELMKKFLQKAPKDEGMGHASSTIEGHLSAGLSRSTRG